MLVRCECDSLGALFNVLGLFSFLVFLLTGLFQKDLIAQPRRLACYPLVGRLQEAGRQFEILFGLSEDTRFVAAS